MGLGPLHQMARRRSPLLLLLAKKLVLDSEGISAGSLFWVDLGTGSNRQLLLLGAAASAPLLLLRDPHLPRV